MVQSSGRSRKDLLGRKLYEFRNYLKPEVYADLRASMAAGKVWHGELVKRHRDGGNYWVSNTSVPVPDIHGGVRQWINIQTDISALRKTEIALQEARSRELEIGTRIQQSLLAATPTQHLPGIWLSCFNQASMVIDGDFVDVIQMGEHCIDIIAGDVMGKGVPAALMGAATKLQFSRSIAELLALSDRRDGPPQPAAIVSLVHSAMGPHLRALEAFVTLAYVRIDTLHQRISWVGCGHEESLVLRADGQTELLVNQHPPLGILEDMVYTQDEKPMHSGDALFLCSDGLADAMGANGERLGHEIVNASVARLALQHQGAAAPLHRLRRELLHEGTQLTDDVTMVLLKWVADGSHCARCELPVALDALRELRQFVQAQTARAALPEQDAAMFEIAAVEVFTNIVRHAKGLLAGAPVEVLSHWSPQALTLECIYLGEAFSPPDELVEADLATYPEGGFGLTIIRNLSDKVEYLHLDGVNTVRMHRFIAG
jgi:PAS domain S-box-containing protein